MTESIASMMGKFPVFGLGAIILIVGAIIKMNWLLYAGIVVAIIGLALPYFLKR